MINPHTPPTLSDGEVRLSLLSSLADGELDADAAARACVMWRDEVSSRADWHAYHLVGDVLRSGDLAAQPRRDAAFLARLRMRLAHEPAIVAPLPDHSAAAGQLRVRALRLQRWLAPTAIAAGFMAVAGVLVVTRISGPTAAPAVSLLAVGTAASSDLRRVGIGASAPVTVSGPMDAALIRDAQIDRYLRAHREMSGGPTTAVPGGVLRSVDTIVPQR